MPCHICPYRSNKRLLDGLLGSLVKSPLSLLSSGGNSRQNISLLGGILDTFFNNETLPSIVDAELSINISLPALYQTNLWNFGRNKVIYAIYVSTNFLFHLLQYLCVYSVYSVVHPYKMVQVHKSVFLWAVHIRACCVFLWAVHIRACCVFLWAVHIRTCCVFLWAVHIRACCVFLWAVHIRALLKAQKRVNQRHKFYFSFVDELCTSMSS